ncbi:MAG: hypothetical protein CM15mP74_31840 [Halieaceae bacterium]|nr:MAG: hypothetical protein CM15mP74_31840 [Halieaceae bacterium]
MDARNLLDSLSCPVIPVIVMISWMMPSHWRRRYCAVALSLEVTLRTPAGYEAIRRSKRHFRRGHRCGYGLLRASVRQAVEVGADFIVAPGATETLYRTARAFSVPFLPGAVTGSEVLSALEQGYSSLKFFPAETSGGASAIRALAGPSQRCVLCLPAALHPITCRII